MHMTKLAAAAIASQIGLCGLLGFSSEESFELQDGQQERGDGN